MTEVSLLPAEAVYVSAAELRTLLASPQLVLFDASIERVERPDGTAGYENGRQKFIREGHIPGALHADLCKDFSDPEAPFSFTRPSVEKLADALQKHGVDDRSEIVVYDALNGVWAARLWWVLKSAGLRRIRILNGGLTEWRRQGGDIAFGEAAPREADRKPGLAVDPRLFSDLEDVLPVVDNEAGARLVCALRQPDYDAGHIPGSLSMPYQAILSDDGLVDPVRTQVAARALGVNSADRLILYCGGGVNAAGLGAALRAIGYDNVSVYDGSLSEWKADPSRPFVRTKTPQ
ncbi:sulfurtransferase [Agrobacterium rhizogenes]|nr:sulfurtransferase [Rhizobium rhizogenes]NTG32208.1 sulfurtransferase [Rhizobium rhizogenes]